jgi:hypothetical protein
LVLLEGRHSDRGKYPYLLAVYWWCIKPFLGVGSAAIAIGGWIFRGWHEQPINLAGYPGMIMKTDLIF